MLNLVSDLGQHALIDFMPPAEEGSRMEFPAMHWSLFGVGRAYPTVVDGYYICFSHTPLSVASFGLEADKATRHPLPLR